MCKRDPGANIRSEFLGSAKQAEGTGPQKNPATMKRPKWESRGQTEHTTRVQCMESKPAKLKM